MSELQPRKEEMLSRIVSGRRQLEQTLARIPEKEMETPILHDGWSVKDTLGHLGYWEGTLVARLNTLRGGGTPEPLGDMDARNARVLAETRLLPAEDVRRNEQETYRQLLDLLQNATPDELFTPDHFPGTGGNAFAAWVGGETWDHYDEHLPELNAWLERDTRS
jgi:hypothetical protein